MIYTGANVEKVTLKKQSDVIIKELLSTTGTINFPEITEALEAGQVLITTDAGETWNVAEADAKPNGVLCESLTEAGEAKVLLAGIARKRYLSGFEDAHEAFLFNNKIILR